MLPVIENTGTYMKTFQTFNVKRTILNSIFSSSGYQLTVPVSVQERIAACLLCLNDARVLFYVFECTYISPIEYP